jgi:hypothetical protein
MNPTKPDFAGKFADLLSEKFKDDQYRHSNKFSVTRGRKFDRIVQDSSVSEGTNRHVHAFVEVSTGHVFKAAGWTGPAKGARFLSVEDAAENADLYGGYLYR